MHPSQITCTAATVHSMRGARQYRYAYPGTLYPGNLIPGEECIPGREPNWVHRLLFSQNFSGSRIVPL
eukprot:2783932-Rhodomonas_salina.1